MQPEVGGLIDLIAIQGDFGEPLVIAAPDRAHTLEGRAVVKPGCRQTVIKRVGRHRHRALWRPRHRQPRKPRAVSTIAGAQRTGGVLNPLALLSASIGDVLRAGVNAELAPVFLVGLTQQKLQLHRSMFGDQGCLQHQFLEAVQPDVTASHQGQLRKSGAGQQHGIEDRVIGQPCMGLRREPSAKQPAPLITEAHSGPQERMVHLHQPH
ncbi:hypothetical protein DSM44344_03852 [Mycobacterium marinum]|nr:hypothetical protein DSM44344_03852 [Mycobacterium marinum]